MSFSLTLSLFQLEVDRLQRKISSLNSRIDSLEIDLKELLRQFSNNEERYDALTAISEAFTRIQATIDSSLPGAPVSSAVGPSSGALVPSAPAGITFDNVVHAFVKLMSRYPKEVLLLGLVDVIPLLSEPLLTTALSKWDIQTDPMALIDLYIQWTSTLSVFEISESSSRSDITPPGLGMIDWNEIKAKGFQDMEPKAIVQSAYGELNLLIEKHSLPKLRRYLLNDWNVKSVEEVRQITQLMNGLQVYFLPFPPNLKHEHYRLSINPRHSRSLSM